MSTVIERIIEGFPKEECEVLTEENLEIFIKHLRATFLAAQGSNFPGGIHGLAIYAILAESAHMSVHASDFEDFTHSNLGIYQQCYGQLLLEVDRS